MGKDFYIAVGCLSSAFLFYTWLTWYNYKNLIATKQERLEARRRERAARKHKFVWPI